MHINLSFRPKIKTLGLIQGPAFISAGLQAVLCLNENSSRAFGAAGRATS